MRPVRVVQSSRESRASPDLVYTLQSSRPLPVVDGAKSIKHVILGPTTLRHFDRFLYRARGWITLTYCIGFVFGLSVLFVEAPIGAWFATIDIILQFPTLIAAYLVLRYDFVKLVLKTFEFWYAVGVNAVCMAVMWLSYSDWRVAMVLSSGIAYEIPFLMDAVHRATAVTIGASIVGAALDLTFITMMTLSSIRDIHPVSVAITKNFCLDADDIVMNGLGTVVVLLTRNAYRKYQVVKHQRKNHLARGFFITYRCCLELRARTLDESQCGPMRSRIPVPSSRRLQLFFDSPDKRFVARHVVWPRRLGTIQLDPWPRWMQRALQLVGLVGLVNLVVANRSATLVDELPHESVLWLALGGSIIYCGTYFVHAQRQLLFHELCRSFDFAFMTSQYTLAHVCACVMLDWDDRSLLLATSWLWSMWVITLDAVTPVMKSKIGHDKRGTILVVVVQLFETLVIIVSVLFFDPFDGRDYSLIVVVGNHGKKIGVVQFFMWRVLTCSLWNSRLLWRLLDRKGDELLVLQGRVEYIESGNRLRKNGVQPTVPDVNLIHLKRTRW